jgi:adenosylcobinamide-GDP ribazoletransferase
MKQGLSRFLSVFTLLSRLPVKASFEPDYSRADFWMPAMSPIVSVFAAAGAVVGLFLVRDPFLGAVLAIAVQYWCFNLFHLDGLLDTADAMAPFASREKRFEILKDSRIGSYAFFFGTIALAAKAGAMVVLFRDGPVVALVAILAAPLAGRLAAALVPLLSPPARPDGLGALMRGFSAGRVALGGLVGILPLAAFALRGGRAALAALMGLGAILVGAAAGGIGLARLYRARIGGFTGDALGAAVETGELACLLVLAATLPLLG